MTNIFSRPEMNLNSIMPQNNISGSSSSENKDLEGAASQFESIFLKMFLDQARQSKLSDDLLGSSASDSFQEMFDSELSQAGGSSMNLGLTEVIVRQLRTDIVK
jgi:Rod binding domain-containing protein|tara:strand:+ start:383 stop:694 length:312 start_codon:yes stop_codon:yes gene_type:complete